MLDGGFLISYKSPEDYLRTLDKIRSALTTHPQTNQRVRFSVPKHKVARTLGRYQIAIFDEKGNSQIDLVLIGATMYILGVRFAEQKWFFSDNQPKEFGGCESEKMGDLGFGCSYPELGLSRGEFGEVMQLGHCSKHVAALANYMRQKAGSSVGGGDLDAVKHAFGYFAVTIGEALRFSNVGVAFVTEGVDFTKFWDQVQNWVVRSSVSDNRVPDEIVVVGNHESRSSQFFKKAAAVEAIDFVEEFGSYDGELADLVGTVLGEEFKPAGIGKGKLPDLKKLLRSAIFDAYLTSRIDSNTLPTLKKILISLIKSPPTNIGGFQGILPNFA